MSAVSPRQALDTARAAPLRIQDRIDKTSTDAGFLVVCLLCPMGAGILNAATGQRRDRGVLGHDEFFHESVLGLMGLSPR